MKLVILVALLSSITTAAAIVVESQRATGGYIQLPSGSASFTQYGGCSSPGTFALRHKGSYADFI